MAVRGCGLRCMSRVCAAKRVARVMRQAGLCAKPARRRVRTTTPDPALAVTPNLLNRDVPASAPNQTWLADIPYLPTQEGWAYVAVVLDLFSRRVIGWAMRATRERDVVISALTQALQQRRPVHDLLHHHDRGSQVARAGIGWSMSRKGNCWDTAPRESFLMTLRAFSIGSGVIRRWDSSAQSPVSINTESSNRPHDAVSTKLGEVQIRDPYVVEALQRSASTR